MRARERLPNRRQCDELRHNGFAFALAAGFYPDGRADLHPAPHQFMHLADRLVRCELGADVVSMTFSAHKTVTTKEGADAEDVLQLHQDRRVSPEGFRGRLNHGKA